MKKLLLLALTFCLTSSAFALDWQMVGARQAAMGGAGVAIAQGIDAQYYNPALLRATSDYTDEVEIGVTFGGQGTMTSSGNTSDEFYVANNTKTDANFGAGIKKGGFAFTIRSLASFITTPSSNKVASILGIFSEADLSYGFQLLRGIDIGANVKVMEGTLANYTGPVLGWGYGFGGLMKEVWSNKKFSTSWGIDAGAAINFSELFQGNFIFDPTIAIVGKNLNEPEFKRPTGPKYKLERQVRIGAAIHPFTDRLTIAGDYDLTENETFVGGYKSRQLAGGIEYLVVNRYSFKVPVRLGVNKNVADNDAPVYFTAGFGTMNTDYSFEMALSVGDGTEKINGNDFPNVMGLSMTFAWKF